MNKGRGEVTSVPYPQQPPAAEPGPGRRGAHQNEEPFLVAPPAAPAESIPSDQPAWNAPPLSIGGSVGPSQGPLPNLNFLPDFSEEELRSLDGETFHENLEKLEAQVALCRATLEMLRDRINKNQFHRDIFWSRCRGGGN